MKTRAVIGSLLGLWLLGVVGAMVALTQYKSSPGAAARPPQTWPAQSALTRAGDRPTVLFVAHPFCPCTRASLTELARLQSRLQGAAALRVLFLKPPGEGATWEHSPLWDLARAIPDAVVVADTDGLESQRFGVATSGQTLLYDAAGALRFAGGITEARGHEGDNPGAERILALVRGEGALATAPVFGCALADADQRKAMP